MVCIEKLKFRSVHYYAALIVFLLGMYVPVQVQAQNQKRDPVLLDSMYVQADLAFDLFESTKFGEAIRVGNAVLKYAEETQNDSLRSDIYGILGNAYFVGGNTDISFQYFTKARDIRIQQKDTVGLILTYNNMAANYMALDNVEKSNFYFKKSLDLGRAMNDNDALVYPLYNVGMHLIDEEEYEEALIYAEEARKIVETSETYKTGMIVPSVYEELAIIYYKLGNTEAYLNYFQKGVRFTKENKYFEALGEFYSTQADLFAEDGKYEEAFNALDQYTIIADTVYTIKEFETAKKIEADNFVVESRAKLNLATKEKELQAASIKKSRLYNIILITFSTLLIITVFLVFKKSRQFKEEKNKAEKLSGAKSDFYSEISHELRTPLYAVIELSRLLLKENVNSSHREYLESLNFSGSHLLSLINNVLELNKVESGKMKIERLHFNLKQLVSNIIESLEYALRDSNNKIHLNFDGNIPKLLVGDSLKLSQILINLISNAIKFTQDGNIYITIKLIEQCGDTFKIFFDVADDGPGISKEKQVQVFEDFYQENAKTDNSYKGTGLGLSIVKRFITAMESEIAINSKEGVGTSFNFELDFLKSDKVKAKNVEEEIILGDLLGKRVLLVDDNKINQLVTAKVLQEFGMKSTVVGSGEEAVEATLDETFDCILMDIHMPGLNGYETTELIRKFNAEVPIIALTATTTEDVKIKIYKYGMNAYVLKPFLKSDFLTALHGVLSKKEITVL